MFQHPVWYLNLTANSERVGPGPRRAARRRRPTASTDEKSCLWDIVRDQWPNYDVYQHRAEIPVVAGARHGIGDDGAVPMTSNT